MLVGSGCVVELCGGLQWWKNIVGALGGLWVWGKRWRIAMTGR